MPALVWQDYAVIVAYLVAMLLIGAYASRRQNDEEEFFLGSRSMPWFAVGVSIIASLVSSLTYLSEPGEVWNSGVTHMLGKMLAIPAEILIVWLICIPFMMRFRFTSAYEYLGERFNLATRRLGAGLFIGQIVLWMGFVVLTSSRMLAELGHMRLELVIVLVGLVTTIYTTMGGLRAVIWTDVVQVALLIGGGAFVVLYVAVSTGTWLPQWLDAMQQHLASNQQAEVIPWFSLDPTVRVTVFTVAVNMCMWHICTHTSNQMTVQRYYSTPNLRAARKSFLTGSVLGIVINLMLALVGLSMVYYYFGQGIPPDGGLDPHSRQERDLIFPVFAVTRMWPGMGGAILAALFAAAMSSIDSGINSVATVLSVELHRKERAALGAEAGASPKSSHVREAQIITLIAGLFITFAAFWLRNLPTEFGIVDAMPRTFNAITGPMGALFLIGMFLPFVRGGAAFAATLLGLAVSVAMGYWKQLGGQLADWGLLEASPPSLSFTWIMPTSVVVTLIAAALLSLVDPSRRRELRGLTWFGNKEKP